MTVTTLMLLMTVAAAVDASSVTATSSWWWREDLMTVSVILVTLFVVTGAVLMYSVGGRGVEPPAAAVDLFSDNSNPAAGKRNKRNKQHKKHENVRKAAVTVTSRADKPKQRSTTNNTAVNTQTGAEHSSKAAVVPPVATQKTPKKSRTATAAAGDGQWDRVLSRKEKREQQQQQQQQQQVNIDSAVSLEAANIINSEHYKNTAAADDSADSGIVNSSPVKTKKKTKNKNKNTATTATDNTGSGQAKTVKSAISPQLSPLSDSNDLTKPTSGGRKNNKAGDDGGEFISVVRKKKNTAAPAVIEPATATVNDPAATDKKNAAGSLTRDDVFNSGLGNRRVLSLEEAMAALNVPSNVNAPKSGGGDDTADKSAKNAGKQSKPAAANNQQSKPAAANNQQSNPGKVLSIEEAMARLRAGADISTFTSSSAAAAVNNTAGDNSTSSKQTVANVAFDELGNAWSEQTASKKDKKKKKSRKD